MKNVCFFFALVILFCPGCSDKQAPVNVVLILTDDQGYGDLSCYGHPTIHTPHLDALASAGVRYTQFYVTSPVCTPSRSSFLSGCYPKRVSMHEHVIFPNDSYGINPDELLLPELFKEAGYATACFGKWHLGHMKPFLPLQNGFDEYAGIPFSNDMSKAYQQQAGNASYPYLLPWMEGNDTLILDPEQNHFTRDLTLKCLDFIRRHANEPFFVYFPHPMPHIPIYASHTFTGTSERGLYGDVIEEIDWSTGQIIHLLKELDLLDQTFVLFTSDNGPWKPFKTHGGSSGPLRGAKGTTWEGGMREPCIIHWPESAHVPKGISQAMWSSKDVLPTLVDLCQLPSPTNKLDGISRLPFFTSGVDPVDEPFFYYSAHGHMEGVRLNQWKYRETRDTAFLFHLGEDISESWNLIDQHPQLADSLQNLMKTFDAKMEKEIRPHGTI